MITRSSSALFLALCISIFIPGCFGLDGQFAYKTLEMDSYRSMTDDMEFPSDGYFDWTFAFSSIGRKKIGIVIVKHELIWIEQKKDIQMTEKKRPYVWGRIEHFEPGEYKIMITYNNTLVAEKPFIIYDPAIGKDDE
jgi:hypothetical protein